MKIGGIALRVILEGAELQDFADEEDEEEDEIEEEDEDEIESSAPRRDGIQLSWAFSNGTIGAFGEFGSVRPPLEPRGAIRCGVVRTREMRSERYE